MMRILADTIPATDATALGWVSVIIQGGAFSLVAYIVTVMYPKLAKEARDEREAHEAQHAATIALLQDKFDTRVNNTTAAIAQQTRDLQASIERNGTRVEAAMAQICKSRA